jgi:LacI family transcriptional regulator
MDGGPIRIDPQLAAGTATTTRQIAEALIAAGHRRLAIVAPKAEGDIAVADQLRDLSATLTEASLPPGRLIEVGAAPDGLDRAFFQVFRGTRYPTGLLCSDATTAGAALRSLRILGFRVPGEMAVMWFADAPASAS